jgi:integration host factor subunit beta
MALVTSSNIAKTVAEANKITIVQAEAIVKSVIDETTKALVAGNEVRINGLGTLKTSVRPAHPGINPKTGAKLEVPEMKVATFTSAKALKVALNPSQAAAVEAETAAAPADAAPAK